MTKRTKGKWEMRRIGKKGINDYFSFEPEKQLELGENRILKLKLKLKKTKKLR